MGREDHSMARTIKESIYIRVNNPTLNWNVGKFNLHHTCDRVLLNISGFKIKRHAQAIGHAQTIQPNTPMPLNQPNTSITLNQPNTPMQFSQFLWIMLREHPCLSMYMEPPRTYIRCWISFLPQTWWSPAVVGWKLVISTNVLFQRI